jgi:hypothetical protein
VKKKRKKEKTRKRNSRELILLYLLPSLLFFSSLLFSKQTKNKQAILGKYSVSDADIQKLVDWKHAH